MDRIVDVADYIIKRYSELTGESLANDEMKLHKLLYFTQRETYAVLGRPAFREEFEGWKYGPVAKEIRNVFVNGTIAVPSFPVSEEIQYIISNVILEYGSYASWKLSEFTHKEISWLNSRKNLCPHDIGNKKIKNEDIQKDSEKVRPYDHVWDMYYDEFEDAPDEEQAVLE